MSEQIEKIRKSIDTLRQEIINHQVYSIIKDVDELTFTENQVVLVKITIDIEFNKFNFGSRRWRVVTGK